MSRWRVRRSSGASAPRSGLRASDIALAVAILVVLGAIALKAERVAQARLAGKAVVIDGDTVQIDGRRLRLSGIDAPEHGQSCTRPGGDYDCGAEARSRLQSLVGQDLMDCEGSRSDRYGRLLVHCRAGDTDINREMVDAGWAVAYGSYQAEEDRARSAHRGIWAGPFKRPQDWRRLHGDAADQQGVLDALGQAIRSFLGRDAPR